MGQATSERSVVVTGESSFWRWLTLEITGLLLLALVIGHIWSVHYSGYAGDGAFTLDAVATRLRSPVSRGVDLGLLVFSLVHGLVGMQRIVLDVGMLGPKSVKVLNIVLTLLGVTGLFYGWAIYR